MHSEEGESLLMVLALERRACAGSHFAEATLWITIAQILATFDIRPAKDADSRDIIPELNASSGLLSYVLSEFIIHSFKLCLNVLILLRHPAPYQCSITPRSQQAVELINLIS